MSSLLLIFLVFPAVFSQRTVPGWRPPPQTYQQAPLPTARPVPNVGAVPQAVRSVVSNATSSGVPSGQLKVAGRIPSQIGASASAFSGTIGTEIGRGVGKIGAGVGEIPKAFGKAAGSVGDALGGGIGGVADSGLNEGVRLAEAVGDTIHEVPGAAKQILSGLSKGSPRQKRETGGLSQVPVTTEILAVYNAAKNFVTANKGFCAIVEISKDLNSRKSQLPDSITQYESLFSAIDSILERASSPCQGIDSSAEVQKALDGATGDLSQIVSSF